MLEQVQQSASPAQLRLVQSQSRAHSQLSYGIEAMQLMPALDTGYMRCLVTCYLPQCFKQAH